MLCKKKACIKETELQQLSGRSSRREIQHQATLVLSSVTTMQIIMYQLMSTLQHVWLDASYAKDGIPSLVEAKSHVLSLQ